MAKISTYPYDNSISGSDTLVGTDYSTRQTKQFGLGSIQSWMISSGSIIIGSGTLRQIPMFTPDTVSIGDSIMRQNVAGTEIQLGGSLTINGSVEIDNDLTVNGNATFSSTITAGGGTGTAGQVLSSTGTGVQWILFVANCFSFSKELI